MKKKIDIEVLKNEVENKQLVLSVDSNDNINNTLSPIYCKLLFDNVKINIFHPACIRLRQGNNILIISQIRAIYKDNKYDIDRYIVKCGKFRQIRREYIIQICETF